MTTDRRRLLLGLGGAGIATTAIATGGNEAVAAPAANTAPKPFTPPLGPRARVMFVNDLSGDIDGLFAAVHAVLSPSIDLRGIVGTGTNFPGETAQRSAALASEMLAIMQASDRVKVYEGAGGKLQSATQPSNSPGTKAIIDEALRTDTALPLFVAVGGGLTELASALLLEPRVAEKVTVVWIGGGGSKGGFEYNFNIDPLAAQLVFNESHVPLWQVPSDVYATCQVSATELQAFVAPCGAIAAWLYAKLFEAATRMGKFKLNTGETYALGDSPLVLLTALGDWVPGRMGSNVYEETTTSHFNDKGAMQPSAAGRKIRVYKSIDTRLMLADFFAKLRVNFGA